MRECCYLSLLLATSLAWAVSPASESTDARAAREAAVELAKAGHYGRALENLRALRATDPSNPLTLYDETAVLNWAGRDREAFENAGQISFPDAPRLLHLYFFFFLSTQWLCFGGFFSGQTFTTISPSAFIYPLVFIGIYSPIVQ